MDDAPIDQFYRSQAYDWVNNIRWKTWDDLPFDNASNNFIIGMNAGYRLTFGSFNLLLGPGVGSTITNESALVIIALPNNRLFRADLRAETAEFMDYSDDAAMVAPEFRQPLN